MQEIKKKGKLFISPKSWFALTYPNNWNEFEDTESRFLFYDPVNWTGNFRISAYKQDRHQPDAALYARQSMKEELRLNPSAVMVKIGSWDCAYSQENFSENGQAFTSHYWLTGHESIVFECSFATFQGETPEIARQIITSIRAFREESSLPKTVIPIRILEIGEINNAFESVSSTVKTLLKKDFTGTSKDFPHMQQIINENLCPLGKKDIWQAMGLVFGIILANEIEELEWVTVIDGRFEYPALCYQANEDNVISPQDIVWGKIKNKKDINLEQEFERIISSLQINDKK